MGQSGSKPGADLRVKIQGRSLHQNETSEIPEKLNRLYRINLSFLLAFLKNLHSS